MGEWVNEACSLKTPYWDVGLKLLNHLLDPAVTWTAVEPKTDAVFETPPTVEHLIKDLYHAEQKRRFKLIDSRSIKPDGISQHSVKNLLDCISSVEAKTFDARGVHYTMKEVAASPKGLGACIPKPIPERLLSVSEIIPKGAAFSLFPLTSSSDVHIQPFRSNVQKLIDRRWNVYSHSLRFHFSGTIHVRHCEGYR
jgi:hypothetical protein